MGAGADVEEVRLLDISWWAEGATLEAMVDARRIVVYEKGNREGFDGIDGL
jgi:hypothetical protein